MMTFYVNLKQTPKFLEYLRENDLPVPKAVGKPQYTGIPDNFNYYQQFMIDLKIYDLTALKLIFDIKHSLFR